MKRHELKTDPAAFDAVYLGTKTHEIRFNDRDFAVGDELLLRQTVFAAADLKPGQTNQYTGRELLRRVTHIQEGYGLAPGWVILSMEVVSSDIKSLQSTSAADYEEVLAGHRRLVRELDVLLNGEAGAARQASLVDIVAQIAGERDAMRRDGATLAQVSNLLTVNGKAPEGPADIVRLVGAHVRMNRDLGCIIHDITVGQQAAWIEWKHGGGAEEAMQWIENALEGPGMIPGFIEDDIDADDPILKDAQAYFDRHSTWMERNTPSDIRAAKLRAAKNDRELLDFVETNLVTVKAGNVPALVGDDIDKEFSVIQYHADEPRERVIGYASTVREALRAAIRATDQQGDLFATAPATGGGAQ